jgi:hypothetical protein
VTVILQPRCGRPYFGYRHSPLLLVGNSLSENSMLFHVECSSVPSLLTPLLAILSASPFADLRTQCNSTFILICKCSLIFCREYTKRQCLWIFPTLVSFWSFLAVLMTSMESPSTTMLVIPSLCSISRPILRPISRDQNSTTLLVEFPRLPVYSRIIFP